MTDAVFRFLNLLDSLKLIDTWRLENVQDNLLYVVFLTTVWYILKAINDQIFNDKSKSSERLWGYQVLVLYMVQNERENWEFKLEIPV